MPTYGLLSPAVGAHITSNAACIAGNPGLLIDIRRYATCVRHVHEVCREIRHLLLVNAANRKWPIIPKQRQKAPTDTNNMNDWTLFQRTIARRFDVAQRRQKPKFGLPINLLLSLQHLAH